MPTATTMIETMVKEYDKTKQFDKDAKKLAKQGWFPQSTEWYQPASGLGRKATIGIFALLWKPKKKLMVTYARQVQS